MDTYQGPDTARLEQAARQLERSHDDNRVRDALGRITPALARDARTGHVEPCHIYRLECGHLVNIYTTPLPEGTRDLVCAQCVDYPHRRVVEHLH